MNSVNQISQKKENNVSVTLSSALNSYYEYFSKLFDSLGHGSPEFQNVG